MAKQPWLSQKNNHRLTSINQQIGAVEATLKIGIVKSKRAEKYIIVHWKNKKDAKKRHQWLGWIYHKSGSGGQYVYNINLFSWPGSFK